MSQQNYSTECRKSRRVGTNYWRKWVADRNTVEPLVGDLTTTLADPVKMAEWQVMADAALKGSGAEKLDAPLRNFIRKGDYHAALVHEWNLDEQNKHFKYDYPSHKYDWDDCDIGDASPEALGRRRSKIYKQALEKSKSTTYNIALAAGSVTAVSAIAGAISLSRAETLLWYIVSAGLLLLALVALVVAFVMIYRYQNMGKSVGTLPLDISHAQEPWSTSEPFGDWWWSQNASLEDPTKKYY